MSGLGAGILGYGNPALLDAVKDQLGPHAAPRRGASPSRGDRCSPRRSSRTSRPREKVRYLLSGTEAVQLVIRLARAYTKRNIFIRFDGHYHGWVDNVFGGGVDPDPQGTALRALQGHRPLRLEGSRPGVGEAVLQAALERRRCPRADPRAVRRAGRTHHHGGHQRQRRLLLPAPGLPGARPRAVRRVRHRLLHGRDHHGLPGRHRRRPDGARRDPRPDDLRQGRRRRHPALRRGRQGGHHGPLRRPHRRRRRHLQRLSARRHGRRSPA